MTVNQCSNKVKLQFLVVTLTFLFCFIATSVFAAGGLGLRTGKGDCDTPINQMEYNIHETVLFQTVKLLVEGETYYWHIDPIPADGTILADGYETVTAYVGDPADKAYCFEAYTIQPDDPPGNYKIYIGGKSDNIKILGEAPPQSVGNLQVNKTLGDECSDVVFEVCVTDPQNNQWCQEFTCGDGTTFIGLPAAPVIGTEYTITETPVVGWAPTNLPQTVTVYANATAIVTVNNGIVETGIDTWKDILQGPTGPDQNGFYTVVYEIGVQNTGAMLLDNISVTDDIRYIFGTQAQAQWAIVSLDLFDTNSSDFDKNPSYDGGSVSDELVNSGSSLEGGEYGIFHLTIRVKPETVPDTIDNQVDADGFPIEGERVEDRDIQPTTFKARPTNIPTLSEWGMIFLGLLMGGTAVVYMRRRNDMTM